jgi:6-phosphogluconolactonase
MDTPFPRICDAESDRMKPVVVSVSACAALSCAGAYQSSVPHNGAPEWGYLYVSGAHPTISIFKLNLVDGTATKVGAATAGTVPSYLAFAPNRKYLYAIDEVDQSRIFAFIVDPASGTLREINEQMTGGAGAPHLAVHPSGRWLVVAHYDSSIVTVHPLAPEGAVGKAVDTRQPGKSAHQAVFASGGRFVFIPCLGSNLVAQYRFEDGKLVPNDPPFVTVRGGPRHMAFDPHERFAYVLGELENVITSFRYDAGRGTLSDPQTLPTIEPGGSREETAHVAVHPSGRFLYVSNGNDNSIAIFSIDEGTGRLQKLGYERGMIGFPRDFTIDPRGAHLIVANRDLASVVIFRIDPASGMLSRVGRPIPVPVSPQFVGVLPAL